MILKKLDIFILRNFLVLFAGTFCISLFVVMMQFLWKYVDELVGKGLSVDVLAKFFLYAAETLVPLALPLAILLAALISFGNLGERFELLSIKAAGISLFRTLLPLGILMLIVSGISFYFQDVIAPEAQKKLLQLSFSMRQKSPELDIPEGVFYDGIEDMNLYVKYKDKETGMLYNVMIYNFRDGTDNAHILLADSASLETSADKQHLLLHLYNGEQFENFNSAALMAENEPYRRETFCIKHFIIEFDSSFNLEDSETFSSSASTKDIVQITADIDSMNQEVDSLCRAYYNDMCRGSLMLPEVNTQVAGIDKNTISRGLKALEGVPFDSIYASLPPNSRDRALRMAIQKVNSQQVDTKFKSEWIDEYDTRIRRHWVQYHQMITLSLACLVFFFIGAPLGAIMRKGGLGLPVVVSVVIFIIYYIINTGGMKLGKQGTIPVWIGMWVSTAVLAPLGVFFTVKSNNDSVVFNMDAYKAFFRKLFGLRLSRHVARKEVIIDDPDYSNMSVLFKNLSERAKKYLASNDLIRFPNYINIFFKIEQDWEINSIADNMEKGIERLSNSKDREIIRLLNYFPFLDPYAHTAPFKNKKLNIAAGVFFPVGIVLIFRIARFRLRLRKDLKNIVKTSKSVYRRCDELETR